MDESKIKMEPDPDYKDMPEAELKKQKTEKLEAPIQNYEKILQIIQKEFQKDINYKRDEVHKIQTQLLKAQKTLHLLRYIVVKSFYENKDVKLTNKSNEINVLPSTSNSNTDNERFLTNESRIHPAVKKLIGKRPLNYEPYRTRLKNNKTITRVGENVTIKEEPDDEKPEIKMEYAESDVLYEFVENEKKNSPEIAPARNRDKNKCRILIGNISKWMPSNNVNDNSTHKWMMYVRGPKENPDISHFVKKVRFFLHPSYQPNDIVDIQEAPFHLSRRGWGEFPLRVQIHFKNPRNKPIDVIHNVKLDRTYSGRQTIGGETLIDVWLYDKDVKNHNEIPCKKLRFDDDNIYIKEELFKQEYVDSKNATEAVEMPNIQEKIINKCPVNNCDILANFIDVCKTNIKELRTVDAEKDPMYGIEFDDLKSIDAILPDDDSEIDENQESLLNNIGIKEVPQYSNVNYENSLDVNRVYLEDHCYTRLKESDKAEKIVVIKAKYVVGKNSLDPNNLIDKEKYKLEVPLEYLKLAKEISYTCHYSYAATSLNEFTSWNPMKQFCSEWSRAHFIKNFLVRRDLEGHKHWSTKSILLYGQAHGFSPIDRFELFHKKTESGKSLPKQLPTTIDTNTLTSVIPVKDLINFKSTLKNSANDYCDIDGVEAKSTSYKQDNEQKPIDTLIYNELPCRYVRENVEKLNMELETEEITPGVYGKTSEQVILKSVMCLAEELIRKSIANNVVEKKLKVSEMEISKFDVFNVLLEREEFGIFLNCGLGKNVTL